MSRATANCDRRASPAVETARHDGGRELREEIDFTAGDVAAFTEMTVLMPLASPRRDHLTFFAVPILETDLARMTLLEGQGMALFAPETLARESRVAPWDLAAVRMHARSRTLFPR